MPAISKLISDNFPQFHQVEPEPHNPQPHIPTMDPGTRSPFLRCPTPPLAPVSVDNLQQFQLNGLIPQYRLLLG